MLSFGHKEDAIREGRRAVDLLPISKDSINGTSLVENLAIIYAWTGEANLSLGETLLLGKRSSQSELRTAQFAAGDQIIFEMTPLYIEVVSSLAPKN